MNSVKCGNYNYETRFFIIDERFRVIGQRCEVIRMCVCSHGDRHYSLDRQSEEFYDTEGSKSVP